MTNSNKKFTIKSFEDLSDILESLYKTQNLLLQKTLETNQKLNQILEIIERPVHLNTDLDRISNQLKNLSLGNPESSTKQLSNKIVLAKPRK